MSDANLSDSPPAYSSDQAGAAAESTEMDQWRFNDQDYKVSRQRAIATTVQH